MPRTDRHAWRWAALALSIAACATLLFVAWNLHHIPSSVTSDFAVFETAHNSSSDGIPGAYDTFVQRHPDWTIKYGADGDVSIGVSVSRVRYTALSVMFAALCRVRRGRFGDSPVPASKAAHPGSTAPRHVSRRRALAVHPEPEHRSTGTVAARANGTASRV